jgi:[ribosomal protein S18]-alanine N-acetyltransferase
MNMSVESKPPIEFKTFSSKWRFALAEFLQALEENGDEQYFHPHPSSDDYLKTLANYRGNDLYYIAVEENTVLAYGLLRGWDEGYGIPSLGIAVHPTVRGIGLSRAFMHFLHIAARRKGAVQIRLRVYPNNMKAIKLYQSLGYVFQGFENQQMVGILTLK